MDEKVNEMGQFVKNVEYLDSRRKSSTNAGNKNTTNQIKIYNGTHWPMTKQEKKNTKDGGQGQEVLYSNINNENRSMNKHTRTLRI